MKKKGEEMSAKNTRRERNDESYSYAEREREGKRQPFASTKSQGVEEKEEKRRKSS